jgi:hypothetical protein
MHTYIENAQTQYKQTCSCTQMFVILWWVHEYTDNDGVMNHKLVIKTNQPKEGRPDWPLLE